MKSKAKGAERPADNEFRALGLSDALLEVVSELGFTRPTAVQAQGIPVLLAGDDLVAQAHTGTGKTAAFALPILERLRERARLPRALVLCPTRELSAQVAREIRRLGRRKAGLRVLVLAGGQPRWRQQRALVEGVHLLVGTPGRVLDHLRRGDLNLSTVRTVVLDEADRMLDMGFAEDMELILDAVPRPRQTAFFSATFPSSIEAMSRKHQAAPLQITIEPTAKEAREIHQVILEIEPDERLDTLSWVLASFPHESALVFTNFKARAREVERALTGAGLSAEALTGDLEQFDRDRVMAKFRNASTRVLVATDVAARGLDIEGLDLVVNYELPTQPELYVHRIGRTGRAGRTGVAVSLFPAKEQLRLEAIEALMGARLEPVHRSSLERESSGAVVPPPSSRDAAMVTLRIAGGRKDKVRPGDILGALTGEAGGLSGADVGKIEIHDTFSFVAVARDRSAAALKGLARGRIKGKRFRVVLED